MQRIKCVCCNCFRQHWGCLGWYETCLFVSLWTRYLKNLRVKPCKILSAMNWLIFRVELRIRLANRMAEVRAQRHVNLQFTTVNSGGSNTTVQQLRASVLRTERRSQAAVERRSTPAEQESRDLNRASRLRHRWRWQAERQRTVTASTCTGDSETRRQQQRRHGTAEFQYHQQQQPPPLTTDWHCRHRVTIAQTGEPYCRGRTTMPPQLHAPQPTTLLNRSRRRTCR